MGSIKNIINFEYLYSVVSSFNWTQPSWDLFILLFFLVGVFLYGFSLGRDRVVAILTALYFSLAVLYTLPVNMELLKPLGSFFSWQVTIFLVLFLIIYFLLLRSGLFARFANQQGRWWQVLSLSILHIGLFLSIILTLIPPTIQNNFSELVKEIFISPPGRIFWISLPILAIGVFRARETN